ncbi:MAG: DUF4129 domain-containing protein [Planctomycetes bacterium]|nr:DUF4129 domain-containing protein [Planctomycetota bacterium]
MRELPNATDIGAAMERVFARPEFRPPEKNFLDRIREWAWERLHDFLGAVWSRIGPSVANRWVGWFVLVALGAVFVFLLMRLLRSVIRSSEAVHRSATGGPTTSERTRLAAEPHLRAAGEHAAAGRFLEAAHALYFGAVLWLDEAGHARFEQSKTGEDYAREVGAKGLGSGFRALLRAFYPVAFGGRAAARDTYERMRSAASEIGVPA